LIDIDLSSIADLLFTRSRLINFLINISSYNKIQLGDLFTKLCFELMA